MKTYIRLSLTLTSFWAGVRDVEIGVAFGKVLRQKRKAAGLTQEKLSYDAEIQRNYVSLMERGVHLPTIAVLFKLAGALGCAPSDFIREVESLVKNIPGQ